VIDLADVRDALSTRLNTVSGIYAAQYDGTASVAPAPSVGYVEKVFVPATAQVITVAETSPEVERTGLYLPRLYSPTGGGSALDDLADDVLAAFPAHLDLAVSGGFVVRIRGDIAPTRGELVASTAGRSAVLVTIPWRIRSAD
jgi:hypothetical protein